MGILSRLFGRDHANQGAQLIAADPHDHALTDHHEGTIQISIIPAANGTIIKALWRNHPIQYSTSPPKQREYGETLRIVPTGENMLDQIQTILITHKLNQ